MRSLPPLTALRAFEAAARLMSFQDAAKELALTPTAISHQIRLLEEFCGEWVRVARSKGMDVPDLAGHTSLSFREDLHGIEAAIAGHGIAICSDILIAPELTNGLLLQVSSLPLEGYGFFIAHRPKHPYQKMIDAFECWIVGQFKCAQALRIE